MKSIIQRELIHLNREKEKIETPAKKQEAMQLLAKMEINKKSLSGNYVTS